MLSIVYSTDAELSDGSPDPDLMVNHLNQNHYGADGGGDSDLDQSSGPADHQENHTEAADPRDARHRDEQGNGRPQAGEPLPGSEGGAEVALVEDQPARYLSAVSLKKRIHTETAKVNNELRSLITKEIRKPGRRTSWKRFNTKLQRKSAKRGSVRLLVAIRCSSSFICAFPFQTTRRSSSF